MLKLLKQFDGHVQSIGNRWQAYLAYFALWGAAVSAPVFLLHWGRPFFPANWGWPEAVVLGIGTVCALVLVASFGAIAWRLFFPIATKADGADAIGKTGLARIADDVNDATRNGVIYKRLSDAEISILSIQEQIAQGFSGRLSRLEGDSEKLLSVAHSILLRSAIQRVADACPSLPDTLTATDEERIADFIAMSQALLIQIGRNSAFQNIMRTAEKRVDELLDQGELGMLVETPNQLTYRKQEITKMRAHYLLDYLRQALSEISDFQGANVQILAQRLNDPAPKARR